jgi:large subunit ribosomal protein LP0
MSKGDTRARKELYFEKLNGLLNENRAILLCNVDNVGSNQMHQIRQSLRGEATLLMGKNTMIRKAVRQLAAEDASLEKLLPLLKGNIGLVFTNGDLPSIREKIMSNRVQAPAKAGAIAPCDVIVPAGNTGMEPGKTSFFQALGVPTKIARGTIEITNDVHLIKANTKVGPSEATLLNMLDISPFTYGLTVISVYDNGVVFDPSILDITNETMIKNLMEGIQQIACMSLALKYPTVASMPHLLVNGYKNLVAISLASDYCIEQVKDLKELLENPEALAAAQAAAASSAPAGGAGGAAKEEAKAEEKDEEESDDDMGFGLFD